MRFAVRICPLFPAIFPEREKLAAFAIGMLLTTDSTVILTVAAPVESIRPSLTTNVKLSDPLYPSAGV